MVVPIGKKIKIYTTASDVIHSWWVPAFSVKRDAVPGYVNEGWFKVDQAGTYRGQCAELCGKDHGFMPIVVRAKPRAEFEQWLAANGGTLPAGQQLAATSAPAAAPAGR